MNRLFKKLAILCSVIFAGSFCMSTASALYNRGATNTSFTISGVAPAVNYTVTLYTDYNGSSWTSNTSIVVADGDTIGSATNPSKSGYYFLGWRESAPVNSTGSYASDFPVQYTTSQLNNLTVTSDRSFYPIFIYGNNSSGTKQAYSYSNNGHRYYNLNTDVTINYQYLESTYIGYRYLGVAGVVDATADWGSQRNLITTSGVYHFKEEGGAAIIERKIGFKPNSSWGASWDGNPGFGIYSWQGGNNSSIHMGNAGSGTTLYAYIPADFENFKFSRYSHNESGFVWGNQSANLSFDNSWWWNNSSTNKYSSSSIVLSMNSWGSWVDDWDSSTATWVAS